MTAGGPVRDLVGQRFGRAVVERRARVPEEFICSTRRACWRCRCDCGRSFITMGHNLVQGGTRSCGCLRAYLNKLRAIDIGVRYVIRDALVEGEET